MNYAKTNACAICGEGRPGIGTFFLLAENRWEDKLTILQWNEQMALRDGIQAACSVNHVEEMVIYWMTTGSLAHPFARTVLGSSGSLRIAEANARVDLTGARPISELAVHRESLERILAEGPQSLQVILDALVEALRRDTADSENGVSASEEVRKKLCEARLKP